MLENQSALPRIAVAPDDAAIVTGRTRTRIFEAIRKEELQARKDGKATLIELPELARWVRQMPIIGRSGGVDENNWSFVPSPSIFDRTNKLVG